MKVDTLEDDFTKAPAPGFEARADKPMLRVLTCGSVDDGKSTLVGRLLFETGNVADDHVEAIRREMSMSGREDPEIDYAMLVDGLEAEREQGITIDIAYRYFSTASRRVIVADAPGHEQFTRNMATGASTADVAIVLVDARLGLVEQTRRHIAIAAALGVRHLILTINKIDLVGYEELPFRQIVASAKAFTDQLQFASVTTIPVSARIGDNLATFSTRMTWYDGPTLLQCIDAIDVGGVTSGTPLRLPVQCIIKTDDSRAVAGTVCSGTVSLGDEVFLAKSRRKATIKAIIGPGDAVQAITTGQASAVELTEHLDISRGEMICSEDGLPHLADQLAATVIWFDERPLFPGRAYQFQFEADEIGGNVSDIKHRINIATLAKEPAQSLSQNEFGVCNIALQAPAIFDTYEFNRTTGAFTIIDRVTNATAGAGMIIHPLRRANNIVEHPHSISKLHRALQMGQKPFVIWLTGLSGAGKSTIANLLEVKLQGEGHFTYLLDGDNVRSGLCRDLGFTEAARVENVRRVAEVSRMMVDSGLIVIVAMISPFAADREFARSLLDPGEFIEVFVETSLEECVRRDPKGLYAKALTGEIVNFTGVGSPYETPAAPEVHLRANDRAPDALALEIRNWLAAEGLIGAMNGRGNT